MTKLIVAFRNFAKAPKNQLVNYLQGNYIYEGWNFNSGKYLFTTDTK